jgi:hypothetical protein
MKPGTETVLYALRYRRGCGEVKLMNMREGERRTTDSGYRNKIKVVNSATGKVRQTGAMRSAGLAVIQEVCNLKQSEAHEAQLLFAVTL